MRGWEVWFSEPAGCLEIQQFYAFPRQLVQLVCTHAATNPLALVPAGSSPGNLLQSGGLLMHVVWLHSALACLPQSLAICCLPFQKRPFLQRSLPDTCTPTCPADRCLRGHCSGG